MTQPTKTPNALSTPATENKPQPSETKPASWAGLWFLLTLMAAMLFFIFLPQIVRLVSGMGQSVAGEYLGTVQRITYVGGLGQHTQIDTETRTFLLRGAARCRSTTAPDSNFVAASLTPKFARSVPSPVAT
jgi:hypothetical protein